jgi:rubrerythrin
MPSLREVGGDDVVTNASDDPEVRTDGGTVPDDPDRNDVAQETLDGREVTRPTCEPPSHPEQSCDNRVERVITVYYGGPAMTTIEWQVCDDHADDVRETGDVRADRPYREVADGFESQREDMTTPKEADEDGAEVWTDGGRFSGSNSEIEIDQYRCHDCGWRKEGLYADEDHDRCPECEAPLNSYYVQKIFAESPSDTELTEEDIEAPNAVDAMGIGAGTDDSPEPRTDGGTSAGGAERRFHR